VRTEDTRGVSFSLAKEEENKRSLNRKKSDLVKICFKIRKIK